MKVHVGLKTLLESKDEDAAEKARQWADSIGLSHAKFRRGILSGDIDPEQLDALKHRSEVAWVEVDEEKHAI